MEIKLRMKVIPKIWNSFHRFLFFLSITVLPFHNASGQFLPNNSTYWYMSTEDKVSHYILELGDNPNPGKTFIVLHGGFGSEHSYLINMVLPHSQKYRFILYDQRGSLRSPASDSTITFRNFVDDLEKLRKELKIDKLQIIGHSNGAMIALDYLALYPENVGSLTLLAAPIFFVDGVVFKNLERPIEKYQSKSQELNVIIENKIKKKINESGLLNDSLLSDKQKTLKRNISFSAHNTYQMKNIESIPNAFYNPDVIKALQLNENSEAWSKRSNRQSKALSEAMIPIVVINGYFDFVDPHGIVWAELVKQAKNVNHISIDKAGHNAWLDEPELFNSILSKWLKDITVK